MLADYKPSNEPLMRSKSFKRLSDTDLSLDRDRKKEGEMREGLVVHLIVCQSCSWYLCKMVDQNMSFYQNNQI